MTFSKLDAAFFTMNAVMSVTVFAFALRRPTDGVRTATRERNAA